MRALLQLLLLLLLERAALRAPMPYHPPPRQLWLGSNSPPRWSTTTLRRRQGSRWRRSWFLSPTFCGKRINQKKEGGREGEREGALAKERHSCSHSYRLTYIHIHTHTHTHTHPHSAGEAAFLKLICELYVRTGKSWLFQLEIVHLIIDYKW